MQVDVAVAGARLDDGDGGVLDAVAYERGAPARNEDVDEPRGVDKL